MLFGGNNWRSSRLIMDSYASLIYYSVTVYLRFLVNRLASIFSFELTAHYMVNVWFWKGLVALTAL